MPGQRGRQRASLSSVLCACEHLCVPARVCVRVSTTDATVFLVSAKAKVNWHLTPLPFWVLTTKRSVFHLHNGKWKVGRNQSLKICYQHRQSFSERERRTPGEEARQGGCAARSPSLLTGKGTEENLETR